MLRNGIKLVSSSIGEIPESIVIYNEHRHKYPVGTRLQRFSRSHPRLWWFFFTLGMKQFWRWFPASRPPGERNSVLDRPGEKAQPTHRRERQVSRIWGAAVRAEVPKSPLPTETREFCITYYLINDGNKIIKIYGHFAIKTRDLRKWSFPYHQGAAASHKMLHVQHN